MSKHSPYLRLEKQIASDERGGIMHRWRYGRDLIKERKGFAKLPKGRLNELIVEAVRDGLRLTDREIQRRIKLATVYGSEAELRQALTEFGSWSEIVNAGFPAVDIDESDPIGAMEEIGVASPEVVEMPLFDIPGFKAVFKVNGKKVDLADATVRQAVEYRDMCRQMHENFGRTVADIESTVELMLQGSGGDLDVNALEAWKRATGEQREGTAA